MAGMWVDYDVESAVRQGKRRRLVGEGATCAECGEDDPFALKRDKDGHVLCLRCRAVRRAKRRVDVETGRSRRCMICGFTVPPGLDDSGVFDLHHVAGRAHLPSHVVVLCKNCHAKASEAQRAFGANLTPQADGEERFHHSFSSAMALVAVAIEDIERNEPESWWGALVGVAPSVLRAYVAVKWVAHRNALEATS